MATTKRAFAVADWDVAPASEPAQAAPARPTSRALPADFEAFTRSLPRPRPPYKPVLARIEEADHAALNAYCEKHGLQQSDVLRALVKALVS